MNIKEDTTHNTCYNIDLSITGRYNILTEQIYENTEFIFNSEFKVINSDYNNFNFSSRIGFNLQILKYPHS